MQVAEVVSQFELLFTVDAMRVSGLGDAARVEKERRAGAYLCGVAARRERRRDGP